MSNGTKTEIARISEAAWREATKLAESLANSTPPVALDALANSLSIQRIRFAPLVSDAGLAKNGEHFEIVVNTDASPIACSEGTTLPAHTGQWSKLHPALRFTVAHEIAHVIFLKAAEFDRQSDLFQKNERAVENGCNILARLLLLPLAMLLREMGDQLFDPEHVINVCTRCRVSPEVMIRRFHVSDMNEHYTSSDGFVAFARDLHDSIRIKACHIFGALARDRFHRALDAVQPRSRVQSKYRSLSDSYGQPKWALESRTIDELQLGKNIESKLRASKNGQIPLRVGWGKSKVIPCNLGFYHVQEPNGFLLCLRVLGPVQEPTQRKLFE